MGSSDGFALARTRVAQQYAPRQICRRECIWMRHHRALPALFPGMAGRLHDGFTKQRHARTPGSSSQRFWVRRSGRPSAHRANTRAKKQSNVQRASHSRTLSMPIPNATVATTTCTRSFLKSLQVTTASLREKRVRARPVIAAIQACGKIVLQFG